MSKQLNELTEEEKEEYSTLLDEWKEYQLHKRKSEYSTQQYINFLLITFNINEKIIPQKSIDKLFSYDNLNTIDIIAISIEEIDMSVSGFLKGNTVIPKSTELSDCITKSIKRKFKEDFIQLSLLQLGGVVLMIFCRKSLRNVICNMSTGYEAVGAMRMANKGGIAFSFQCYDTWICIIGSHLAAHQNEIQKRNKNFYDIYHTIELSPIDGINGKYCKKIHQHDIILWLGDLNYRIDEEDLLIRQRIESNTILDIIETHDQLIQQRRTNELLREFHEFGITFQPTYKYIPMTDNYNEKRRPAYCDRILWKRNK